MGDVTVRCLFDRDKLSGPSADVFVTKPVFFLGDTPFRH